MRRLFASTAIAAALLAAGCAKGQTLYPAPGTGSVVSVACPNGTITTSGSCKPLSTGGTSGDIITSSGSNNVQDSGTALAALAALASPTFTGTPAAPTPSTADNSTKIATTAYVQANLAPLAPLASPTFTGTITTPVTGASNQCLHVSSTGVLSGTGSDCGAGGGGGISSITATSPLTGGVITTSGSIGLPAPLAGATANYTAHGVLLGEGSASALAATAAGSAGQLLISGGASADPAFSSLASLTSSGFSMAGATGGGEGADTVNAKNFYQNGSLIQVVPFSSSCTPPTCTYTLPGITDTLAGVGTTETITAAWTFNNNINVPNGVGFDGAAGVPFNNQTIPSNGGAWYVPYSDSGASDNGGTAFGIGTYGTYSGASGVLGGLIFDPTINQSGTAGWFYDKCNPTISASGSGHADCFLVTHGSTRYAGFSYSGLAFTKGFTVSTLPAAASQDVGSRAYVTDQTTSCPSPGGALTGSGSVVCPVFDNGSAWVGE